MNLSSTKEFPFSMETAWAALHKPAMLDVEPGSEVKVISDTEWEAHNSEAKTETLYKASFDEGSRTLTIEGISKEKAQHDFIYLSLEELAPEKVSLTIRIEINTGVHLIAKALGALFAKPMQEILCRHINHNFEALCMGKETKQMSKEELEDFAKKTFEK